MKNEKLLKYIIIFLLMLITTPSSVYANSSWHWISSTCPLDVLPFAIIATLIIEIFIIVKFGKVRALTKSIVCISFANLASFLVSYLWPNDVGYTFSEVDTHTPSYIVRSGYLFLTLIVEVPIVYYLLRKDCDNRKKLLLSTILANVITTALVAAIERISCVDSW